MVSRGSADAGRAWCRDLVFLAVNG